MSKRTLGSLADLAKIIEEASNPESALREDRKESKPKALAGKKHLVPVKTRIIDPKKRAWYDKRLKEQVVRAEASSASDKDDARVDAKAEVILAPSQTRAVATKTTAGLLQVLASANMPKAESKNRPEAWRRKPGDPVF